VLEGDFVSPEVAAQAQAMGVRSLFLHSDDAEIRENFLDRDGDEQAGRAHVSAEWSRRAAEQCVALGVPVVPARPFDSLLVRALSALRLD